MWSSRSDSNGKNKRKASDAPNFAQTCNLLSRYMKEKGSLRDLNLEIGGKVESLETLVKPGSSLASSTLANSNSLTRSGKSAHTSPVNPIIVVEGATDKASTSTSKDGTSKTAKKSQLTIFYSGKVLVFDNFPADKIRELVHVAKRGSSQMSYGFMASTPSSAVHEKPNPRASTTSPREGLPPRPQAAAGKQHVCSILSNTFEEKMSASVSEAGPSSSKHQEELSPTSSEGNGSDLPIARRSSLHRFLAKRKDRAALREPYQNQEHPPPFKGDQPLDLNSFPDRE